MILAGFLEAGNRTSYSAIDAVKAQEYADDFQRASGEQIATWLREHAEWMASHQKRPYGKLQYYAEYLVRKYSEHCDGGASLNGAGHGTRVDQMASTGEVLKRLAPLQPTTGGDPDDD